MAEDSMMLKMALWYAKNGLRVFPCGYKTKAAVIKEWAKNATTDEKQIRSWWAKDPHYNIATPLGLQKDGSYIIAIDADENEEKNEHGREDLAEWERKNGAFPETWTVDTPTGGQHLYFIVDKDHCFTSVKKIADGIDTRGIGGYAMLPPSTHANDGIYKWDISPTDAKIAAANDSVNGFIGQAKIKAETSKETLIVPTQIPNGKRADTLMRLACSLMDKGLDPETIKKTIKSENVAKCVPPMTDAELEKDVFKIIGKYEPTHSYAVVDDGKVRESKPLDFTLQCAADIEEKEPEWLISGYIPKYGITTVAGEGGIGKTSLWCDIVASVTTGHRCLLDKGNNIPFDSDKTGTVIVFSAEDSWEYILKKRLEDAGADMTKVFLIGTDDERFNDLNFNGDLLKGIIATYKPTLVVFDPLQSFVPANLKMADRNAMRKCFAPLMGYGKSYGTTSLIIAHANKQSNAYGRKRIADSSDIWDASRSVLMVGEVPDSDTRYISHEKCNWGQRQKTILFELNGGKPEFKGISGKRDRDFIMDNAKVRATPAEDSAKDFIISTLDDEPDHKMEMATLDEMAQANGFTKNSIRNAKATLKTENRIKVSVTGYRKEKKWFISLLEG